MLDQITAFDEYIDVNYECSIEIYFGTKGQTNCLMILCFVTFGCCHSCSCKHFSVWIYLPPMTKDQLYIGSGNVSTYIWGGYLHPPKSNRP